LHEAIRIAEFVSDKDVSLIRIAVAPGEHKGQTAKAKGNIAGAERLHQDNAGMSFHE